MSGGNDEVMRDLVRRAHEADPEPVAFDVERGLADLLARAGSSAASELRSSHGFWGMLTDPTRRLLRAGAEIRRYPAGSQIMREGDRSTWVLVLTSGRVKVVTSAAGKESLLGIREPGDIVGEMGVVDAMPRSASVIALDEVTGLWVSADRFARLMREPEVSAALLKIISDRLRLSSLRRAERRGPTTTVKIAALLDELVQRYGLTAPDGVRIALRVSQHDMAELVSASRQAVARVLRELRRDGVISTGDYQLVVHRPEVLAQMVS